MVRLSEEERAGLADFGGIALYLMSMLSSYHTGDCLVIDGGYSKC